MRRIIIKSRNLLANLVLVCLLILNSIGIYQLNFYSERYLEITFLDIGQGDSFLVSTPDKVNLLVDAGKGDSVIGPLEDLLDIGEAVDVVMLSHPDADHVGNLAWVVKEKAVTQAIVNPIDHNNESYEALKGTIQELGAEQMSAHTGDIYRLGCCVILEILWPDLVTGKDLGDDVNNQSIAFLLRYGEFVMFAGGDLGSPYEENLRLSGPSGDGNGIDVLKVGHHGSKTSSDEQFLNKVRPYISVIQVGQGNGYGHPAPEVLQNLENAETRVYRNDVDGQITYRTDGYSYELKTNK